MPPMTSSRAGTRVTQISPAAKKLARPEASLLGLRRSCSNSETSNGSSSFIMLRHLARRKCHSRSRQSRGKYNGKDQMSACHHCFCCRLESPENPQIRMLVYRKDQGLTAEARRRRELQG